ncbi:chorismate--pyruvate lyase family protein [Oceanisphaera sp. IT1-181]|uniref:chorismate--pyruvate lyase family protein n=1 Tax=Oceanisphaera sp. IT1-181 TaxID=3081199 RepID=UPI0029CA3800|nr:chorismate lyase [Oceanisphaera sp. IT1-181]
MNATVDAHWRWQFADPAQPAPSSSSSLNHWLQDTGSLTARLRLHCKQFRVLLLNTRADVPFTPSQANWLGETHGYCREVLLLCDEQPWIYASSLYSNSALQAVPALGGLGPKALGELLFDHPQLIRSQFEFAQLTALESQQLAQQVHPSPLNIPTSRALWARRSVLAIPQASVLVSELFLPAARSYRE